MRIKSVYIDGFRRFKAQTIQLENNSTVIAGANNSGKTSLIDLFRVVLGDEASFRADDLCAENRIKWIQVVIESAIAGEENFRRRIDDEKVLRTVPSIKVKLEVTYDPQKDDIREFADYLMDLDTEKNAFYFKYVFAPNPEKFLDLTRELYPLIEKAIKKHNWESYEDSAQSSTEFLAIQTAIDDALVRSSEAKAYFADEDYSNVVLMESPKSLSKLFNFHAVKASRALDDTSEDKSGGLNKRLISVAKQDKDWDSRLAEFPGIVVDAIASTGIRELTTKETLKSLNEVIDSISQTNGTAQNDLFVDFQMTEELATHVISRSMQTRYMDGGAALGEASQGLGYSNLIYLHLEAESFIRAASAPESEFLVNLLVMEEPESHMHPQMQNAFIRHFFERVDGALNVQALVTTHSSEIIRSSKITQLRVLKVECGNARVVDLRDFHESNVKDKSDDIQRLFSYLYSINFSDVLFADKVIMYEGDTERMYIQALIENLDRFAELRGQYVSYIQVGGAYAHIYKPLIVDTLHLKTVIITDLDYDKESDTSSVEEVEALSTTNGTLNALFSLKFDQEKINLTIGDLQAQISPQERLAVLQHDRPLGVAFQTAKEGYSRTLEEAILSTIHSCMVWDTKTVDEWKNERDASKLRFSIPKKTEHPSIRDIVKSTEKNKTDFMYSLLLTDEFKRNVPGYILAALDWLKS